LSLHIFTSGGAFSNYRNVASKASNKDLPCPRGCGIQPIRPKPQTRAMATFTPSGA
jgi:hypothetical protein